MKEEEEERRERRGSGGMTERREERSGERAVSAKARGENVKAGRRTLKLTFVPVYFRGGFVFNRRLKLTARCER